MPGNITDITKIRISTCFIAFFILSPPNLMSFPILLRSCGSPFPRSTPVGAFQHTLQAISENY
jgi:hypothetical protein